LQLNNENQKLEGVMNLLHDLRIDSKTENKINELYDKSLQSLDAINLPKEKKDGVRLLAESIHNRDY